jgi:hypothetical protein
MKNIHVVPTDNYSSLVYSTSKYGGLFLSNYYSPMKEMGDSYQNIYITSSNEEIKEGDWFYDGDGELCKYTSDYVVNPNGWNDNKKIILTTDQDLIQDGIQPINDEFLEWFVKNPSCEEVEVDLVPVNEFGSEITVTGYGFDKFIYKIILPNEEPKEEYIKCGDCNKYYLCTTCGAQCGSEGHFIEITKQESLKEAAERLYPVNNTGSMFMPNRDELNNSYKQEGFIDGYNKAKERMYSEEDMIDFGNFCINLPKENKQILRDNPEITTEELLQLWFEQFKKK